MRDFLRRFKREPEIFRRQRFPIFNRLWRRDSAKSVIDFGGRKSLSVKRQHLRRRQIFRVKIPLPFRVLKTRGADPEFHARD